MIKKVIITMAAGLVSFAGAFIYAWLTHSPPASPPDPPEEVVVADRQVEPKPPQFEIAEEGAGIQASAPATKSMTEQQLKDLIRSIRGKMRDYDNKFEGLAVKERRLQVAQQGLKEDVENLNNLRIELASTIARLKTEQDRLHKSRLEIGASQKVNLVSIAATYDKMEATSASTILTNMCRAEQAQNVKEGKASSSFDDAVMILHYMTDRTKAKLLAELATSEPALAASLCNRLKQIVERE